MDINLHHVNSIFEAMIGYKIAKKASLEALKDGGFKIYEYKEAGWDYEVEVRKIDKDSFEVYLTNKEKEYESKRP